MKHWYYNSLGLLIVAGALIWGGLHLYQDHRDYHRNMQLVELMRQVIVEKHPELAQEAPQ